MKKSRFTDSQITGLVETLTPALLFQTAEERLDNRAIPTI